MRIKRWAVAVLVLVLLVSAGACKKFVTHPIYRRPVIHSVVAFPTSLGPGDSTMITIFAADPDGDSLVYDWEAFNGLTIKGGHSGFNFLYNTPSPSQVFYRSPAWPYANDTAFVWCGVRDLKGGESQRQVLVYFHE